jgi:hypothetical protein
MDTNWVGAIDADLLRRVNRPYHFTPFIILLRTLRSEVLKNLQTSEETATDGTDYTDVKKIRMMKGEGWWIGFSEDDASIVEGARFIWRQNRIVCQRVEDNAFHLVYQLSLFPNPFNL